MTVSVGNKSIFDRLTTHLEISEKSGKSIFDQKVRENESVLQMF